jgi:hypothetical protein
MISIPQKAKTKIYSLMFVKEKMLVSPCNVLCDLIRMAARNEKKIINTSTKTYNK